MPRRFGRLPPLTSLEGFEAAARLKSFSLAAEELNITQSAVSHQIRALEAFFQLELFNRVGRSVELTIAGADFLESATQSLTTLAKGRRRLSFYYRPGSVVWGATMAFASKWLVPRYNKLQMWFPDIQPWLFTTDDLYELESEEVDLAIWFGDGDWHGMEATKLFHDEITPLLSPATYPATKIPKTAKALLKMPLLHDERSDDWLSWFNMMGLEDADTVEGAVFSDSGLLLESAAFGQGVALGSLLLGKDLIESGKLIQPFPDTITTKDAYYLVHSSNQTLRPAVEKAKEWLLKEVEEFNKQGQGEA